MRPVLPAHIIDFNVIKLYNYNNEKETGNGFNMSGFNGRTVRLFYRKMMEDEMKIERGIKNDSRYFERIKERIAEDRFEYFAEKNRILRG